MKSNINDETCYELLKKHAEDGKFLEIIVEGSHTAQ